jgi:predicted nucleic acid-binding protein
MVLIDTSAWIEWLTDSPLAPDIAPHLQRLDDVVVPTIVQYELYKWAARERDDAAALELVGLTGQGRVQPLDSRLTVSAAEASAQFRLPMADAIVYVCARGLSVPLVTCDAHFETLAGVEYLQKRAPGTRA